MTTHWRCRLQSIRPYMSWVDEMGVSGQGRAGGFPRVKSFSEWAACSTHTVRGCCQELNPFQNGTTLTPLSSPLPGLHAVESSALFLLCVWRACGRLTSGFSTWIYCLFLVFVFISKGLIGLTYLSQATNCWLCCLLNCFLAALWLALFELCFLLIGEDSVLFVGHHLRSTRVVL